MAAWPDLTEYHEAVQHPQRAFADPGLKVVNLELDRFGMPKPATGAHAPAFTGALRAKWVTLVRQLEAAQVAHGDLQHGNILVRGGSIPLVDYDGMWVPALRGRHATETGHRAYQHPERSGQDYGQEIDRFSALVIYLSLAALERDVTLWERFHTGDNLIFVREDFQQLGRSAIWQQLRRIGSREIDQLAAAVAAMVQQHPMKVGNLDSVPKNPPSNPASPKPPTSIPASSPAQRVAPKPLPTPPVPSWMKKSG